MATNDMLRIPYGETDFSIIRRDGYYYVDKTRFIEQMEREGIFVFFLRPRRFGKSLFLAMLQTYYDVKYKDQFDELFQGLDIYAHPTPRHNQYLILKFNFSGVDSKMENLLESFNTRVNDTLRNFVERYSEYFPIEVLQNLKTRTKCDDALSYVLERAELLGLHIYLLIDEYDNFANTLMSENEGDYKTITHGVGMFRLFFNIIKLATTGVGSPIERMFITGVSPLTLSDVTSGFNIGDNLSLMPQYNDMVGFTETEVRRMLEYYRDATGIFHHTVDELLEIMRPWYDNNCFSSACVNEQHMFNSDMTLYFIKKYIGFRGQIPEYMIDTNVRSDYNKMRRMVKIEKSFGEKAQTMQQIFENRGTSVRLQPEFSIEDLLIIENLSSHLFYMGLLTYGKDKRNRTRLIIPNQVVYEQYYKYMEDCYDKHTQWFTDINIINRLADKMVYDGEGKPLLDYICHQITTDSSNRDFDPQAEAFVKGFLLSKLGGHSNSYFITTTEPEENHGYSDLYMEPWNDYSQHSFLIELKFCKHGSSDAEVQQKRQDAIDQLNRYAADKALQQKAEGNGWTFHRFAIVYRGWECELVEEI